MYTMPENTETLTPKNCQKIQCQKILTPNNCLTEISKIKNLENGVAVNNQNKCERPRK